MTRLNLSVLFGAAALAFAFSGCTKEPALTGKVLHIPLQDAIRTSDPTNIYDIVGAEVAMQIYETPLQYNYFREKPVLVPLLTEGMPAVSKDGLTYTLKIKKGIRFQDDACFKATGGKGRELKAQDFVYAWKRHANPANESQGFWIWDNRVIGINEFQKKFGKDRAPNDVMKDGVEGFKIIDDYTIQIRLLKPYPQLMYIFAMTFTSPVPFEAIEAYGKDFVHHPVGTGPFRVKTYYPTSHVVLVKNENFREEFFPKPDQVDAKFKSAVERYDGKRLPLVDGIEFHPLKEEQPRWLGFLSGKYDVIKIPKDNFDSAVLSRTEVKPELKDKGIFVSVEPSYGYWYVSMNMLDKTLNANKFLRQAIASSIDQTKWLSMFKNGRGAVQTEVSPINVSDRCGKPYRWAYDVNRAKELLAKAGFPGGKGLPALKYDLRGTDQSERQLGEFIQKSLGAIGIQVEIVANTFPAYLDKARTGNLQLNKGGWIMDYPDAENNYQLLYGPNKAPGPGEANFQNAKFDALYDKMAILPSGPARKQLICQMEEIIQEEAPWAYGIYEDEYRLAQGRVKNYHAAELIFTKWKYVDLEK